jgi:uncharacterized protein (DUF1330 family)
MKNIFGLALAGGLGLVAGASGMSLLHAQTATPKAYLFNNITEIKDPDSFKKYQAQVAATQVPYGVHAIVRNATPVMLSQTQPVTTGTVVILEFPSMKNLTDWFNSPAYAAIRPLRENSTTGRIFAVEGQPPQ